MTHTGLLRGAERRGREKEEDLVLGLLEGKCCAPRQPAESPEAPLGSHGQRCPSGHRARGRAGERGESLETRPEDTRPAPRLAPPPRCRQERA